jgi:hypothetical protein
VIKQIEKQRPGFTIRSWAVDHVTRVWLLLQLESFERDVYLRTIENVFLTAEMHEQVALYSALPLLKFPEAWRHRCTEGIRSNIGLVLESIMCDNPYPSENLSEAEWNQMVLKAIFTEKPIERIIGLDERSNKSLADTLSDYAHERWAAHRMVNPMLWRCVGPFVDEKLFPDIERIAGSDNELEVEAAALVLKQSSFAPLHQLPERFPRLRNKAKESLTWNTLAQKVDNATQK